jgi:hypothetical protein
VDNITLVTKAGQSGEEELDNESKKAERVNTNSHAPLKHPKRFSHRLAN